MFNLSSPLLLMEHKGLSSQQSEFLYSLPVVPVMFQRNNAVVKVFMGMSDLKKEVF
jgi:hypothetical protein